MEHKPSAYIPPSFLTWGRLAVRGSTTLVAGARGTLDVEVTLDQPLSAGHRIEVWTHFVSDIERPQNHDENGPAYFACQSSGPAVETFVLPEAAVHGPNTFFPYRRYAGFRLLDPAPAGTRLTVQVQNASMQSYEEPLFNLRLAILNANQELAGYLGDACYTVVGGAKEFLRVVAPTCVAAGQPFRLAIVACDRYRNKTGEPLEDLAFVVGVEGEAGAGEGRLEFDTIVYDPAGRRHTIEGARCDTPGVYYVRVAQRGAPTITGTSNPIVVRTQWAEQVYWGDLHQHSYHDDGRGLPAANYDYARSSSMLDFCAITPHQERAIAPAMHRLPGAPVQQGWDELIEAAETANGSDLVTFLGSEASSLGPLAGHMNAYYLDHRNRPEFERLGWDPASSDRPDIGSYERYLAVLEQSRGEFLLLPHAHAGGSPGRFTLPKRPAYQTNVEICSLHGVFEEFYRQWLRHGHFVGVHGSGDNHMTSTGNGNPGYHYANTNGLAAVFAAEKSRPAIWQGIRDRRTYAVTANQRIFLDFSIDGKPMGRIVAPPAAAPLPRRSIRIEAAGTAPLLKLELFRGDEAIQIYRPPLDRRRYLRLVWTDSYGSRRVDDSLTTGHIALSGGKLRLLRALNTFTCTDSFVEEAGAIRFRSNGYSGITRGVLLEAPPEADFLRFQIADRHLGQTFLDERLEIPLHAERTRLTRPLPVDPAHPRWRHFGPEAHLPEFTLDVDWVELQWPRTITLEWTDEASREAYYYLRLEQIDGAIAWSSPIWLGGS
jgi:hypothetical protein